MVNKTLVSILLGASLLGTPNLNSVEAKENVQENCFVEQKDNCGYYIGMGLSIATLFLCSKVLYRSASNDYKSWRKVK